jgi:class 3 adenylate cyclase
MCREWHDGRARAVWAGTPVGIPIPCSSEMLGAMGGAQQTFLFADLAGFTALSEVQGGRQAADVAVEFSEEVRRLLGSHSARQIKAIGDALMIVGSESAAAIGLAGAFAADPVKYTTRTA